MLVKICDAMWSHYQVIPLHEPINISGAACGRFVVHPLHRSKSGFCKESVHQSINQSTHQPINQPINQSINQSTNQSTNQSINQSIRMSICLSVYRSFSISAALILLMWFSPSCSQKAGINWKNPHHSD